MVFDEIKDKVKLFFVNYQKILLAENEKTNEGVFKQIGMNPCETFKNLETNLNIIKHDNENVNEKNFKKLYNSIFTLNAELR
jgi:hypothetical protein